MTAFATLKEMPVEYKELENLRDWQELNFVHEDDPTQRAKIMSMSDICYCKGEPEFKLIDMELTLDYNNFYGSTTHEHDVYFRKSSNGVIAMMGYGNGRYFGYQLPDDAAIVDAELLPDNKSVIYREIYPGIDLRLENSCIGVNKYFIVHRPEDMRPLTLKILATKVDVTWDDFEYQFSIIDKETQEKLFISKPIDVQDDSVVGAAELTRGLDLKVDFVQLQSGVYQITIDITKDYLDTCQFPIEIDPSTTIYPRTVNSRQAFPYKNQYRSTWCTYGSSGCVYDYSKRCSSTQTDDTDARNGYFWGRTAFSLDLSGFTSNTTFTKVRLKVYNTWAAWSGWTYVRWVTRWDHWDAGWTNRPNDYRYGWGEYIDKTWCGDPGSGTTQNATYEWEMASFFNNRKGNGDNYPVIQLDTVATEYKYPGDTFYDEASGTNSTVTNTGYAWRDWNVNDASIYVEYTTNTAPNAPSSITVTEGLYESSIPISWGAGSDPNGDSITYTLELAEYNSSNGTWGSFGVPSGWSGLTSRSVTHNITGMTRGNRLQYRVKTVDSYGASSGYAYSGTNIKRNRPPSNPVFTSPAVANTEYEGSIPVSWNASTEPDSQTFAYAVQVQKNSGTWTNVKTGFTGTSFDYDISGDARQTTYKFRIWATDASCLDNNSASSATIESVVVKKKANTPPNTPAITYPVTNGIVYNTRPRICITLGTDAEGQAQRLGVCWDNTWYYSDTNSTMFTTSGNIASGGKTVFRPPANQTYATHTVKTKAWDGYDWSAESAVSNVIVTDPSWTYTTLTANTTFIKKADVEDLRDRVNKLRAAYGLGAKTWTDATLATASFSTGTGTIIDDTHIKELQKALDDVQALIGNFDKTNTTWDIIFPWTTAAVDTNVFAAQVIELRKAITEDSTFATAGSYPSFSDDFSGSFSPTWSSGAVTAYGNGNLLTGTGASIVNGQLAASAGQTTNAGNLNGGMGTTTASIGNSNSSYTITFKMSDATGYSGFSLVKTPYSGNHDSFSYPDYWISVVAVRKNTTQTTLKLSKVTAGTLGEVVSVDVTIPDNNMGSYKLTITDLNNVKLERYNTGTSSWSTILTSSAFGLPSSSTLYIMCEHRSYSLGSLSYAYFDDIKVY